METIGIICEYNPFHNGHLYHLDKIKEMYSDSRIILVMSGNFLQRGDCSLINKWDKTRIALEFGVDLVVELPFVFATQSADVFAHGAVSILNNLGVNKIVFGSECNDIELLWKMADIQINNKQYDEYVCKYMDLGYNYPTSMSYALKDLGGFSVSEPNDILGLCYIKEILIQNSNIEPICIKRTSDYNSDKLDSTVVSARAIRNLIKEGLDYSKYVPYNNYISNCFIDKYFYYLKYKILTSDISLYQTVDEGIKYRIDKYIVNCNSLEELIDKVKTKRYTYNRLKRMFLHILCSFTKEEANMCKDIHYIRVLGFNDVGRNYLKNIKKSCDIPIITNFSSMKDIMLDIEFRVNVVYSLGFDDKQNIVDMEYMSKPIMK